MMCNHMLTLLTMVSLQENLPKILILVFAIVLPFLLLIITLIYMHRFGKLRRRLAPRVDEMQKAFTQIEDCDMKNLPEVDRIIEEFGQADLSEMWQSLKEDSLKRYNGRWLPPLEPVIDREHLCPTEIVTSLSLKPALTVASVGIFGAVLLYIYIHGASLNFFPGLALIPLAAGLLLASYLANSSRDLGRELDLLYGDLRISIARALPVYNSNAGTALLIDELNAHENHLGAELERFHQTARKMAESDFSQGICESVRQIMQREVTPPLQTAASTLGDLARNLDRRQMTGMENLARQFSAEVSRSLAEQLNPLREELHALNDLMGSTRSYVEGSVKVLESSREENISLNRDITESLQLMTLAKNDLANEMAELSDNIRIISSTTEKMTSAYAGEEASLSEKIKQLSISLEQSLGVLSRGLQGSTAALQLVSELKSDQQKQHEEFSARLQHTIDELNEISETMRISSKNFTQESAAYVNQTLKSFDNGLAEVVERLIFTASAIRDAVDALPVALRPGKDA